MFLFKIILVAVIMCKFHVLKFVICTEYARHSVLYVIADIWKYIGVAVPDN
jgi:hypothetical protein